MLQYLKNNFQQGKKFLLFTSLKAIAQLTWFVVPLFVARTLSPEKYGAYTLGAMVLFFCSAFFVRPFVQKPLILYAGEEYRDTKKINRTFSASLFIGFLATLFTFLLFLIFQNLLADFISIKRSELIYIFLGFFGVNFRHFVSSLFVAVNRNIATSIYTLLVSLASVVHLFFLLFWDLTTIPNFFLIYFFSPLIVSIPFFFSLGKKILLPFSVEKKFIINLLNYTKWIIWGTAAVYFLNWGDNIILRKFVSLEQIGIYNLAYQFFKGSLELIAAIGLYFFPFLINHVKNHEKIKNYLYFKRPKIILLGLLGVVFIYFISPWFISTLFGEKYLQSIIYLRVLLLGVVFSIYQIFYQPIFNALKKFKAVQMITLLGVIYNLLMDYLLIYFYGTIGAAIATASAYFLMALMYEFYYQKYCKKIIFSPINPTDHSPTG